MNGNHDVNLYMYFRKERIKLELSMYVLLYHYHFLFLSSFFPLSTILVSSISASTFPFSTTLYLILIGFCRFLLLHYFIPPPFFTSFLNPIFSCSPYIFWLVSFLLALPFLFASSPKFSFMNLVIPILSSLPYLLSIVNLVESTFLSLFSFFLTHSTLFLILPVFRLNHYGSLT